MTIPDLDGMDVDLARDADPSACHELGVNINFK